MKTTVRELKQLVREAFGAADVDDDAIVSKISQSARQLRQAMNLLLARHDGDVAADHVKRAITACYAAISVISGIEPAQE